MNKVVNLFPSQKEDDNMDVRIFREHIVRPALHATSLCSQSAENLLIGTALVESNLCHLVQVGGGPGKSWWQIEDDTHWDCIRYLYRRDKSELRNEILDACGLSWMPEPKHLIFNIRLACLIARVKYWMQPEALPDAKDADGLCRYYIKYYNTKLGASTFDKSIGRFEEACNE